jgi:methylglyoxal synthase
LITWELKAPSFSYNRLKGADPVAGVEMASTGEVACLGDNLLEAFYTSWLATEQSVKGKRLLLSVAGEHRSKILEEAQKLHAQGWEIFATVGTHNFLKRYGVRSKRLYKIRDKTEPSIATAVVKRKLDLMINIPLASEANRDAYTIRRLAIDNHIPLITNAEVANILLRCLAEIPLSTMEPRSWQEFVAKEE